MKLSISSICRGALADLGSMVHLDLLRKMLDLGFHRYWTLVQAWEPTGLQLGQEVKICKINLPWQLPNLHDVV